MWLAAMAATTALCASVVLSGCDDDSSTKASSKDLVTVKVLLDSIVCHNEAEATVKEINSSTYKIMCGKDSVGYASTGEYSSCNVDVHDDELGVDLICDREVVGEVNFKQEKSSSSKKAESSSSVKPESSSSEKAESSSSEKEVSSSSAKEGKSSSSEDNGDDKSSSSKKDDKSSSSVTCELLELPEPIAYASEYVDCSAEYGTLEGAEYWNVNVASVSADTARMLWSIGGQGFTVNSGFTKYTNGTYMASGSKVTKDGYKYSVQLSLTVKDDKRYSGNIEFQRKSATCDKIVEAYPNDFVCVNNVATAVADVAYCGEDEDATAYNKKTHFCLDDTSVESLCGGKSYNMEEFCFNDKVYSMNDAEMCGDKLIEYDHVPTQFCDDGTVVDYGTCGTTEYDPREKFCDTRDNQIYGYVKIGEQTWMSENLNFFDPESKSNYLQYSATEFDTLTHCTLNDCAKYGRAYSWSAAMGVVRPDGKTVKELVMPADTLNHQGICPSGWRMPAASDYVKLFEATGSVDNSSGSRYTSHNLCASSDIKDSTGTLHGKSCRDSYGFGALPTGVWVYGREKFSRKSYLAGTHAIFWVTNYNESEDRGADTYLRFDIYNAGVEDFGNQGPGEGIWGTEQSVRCIKNSK